MKEAAGRFLFSWAPFGLAALIVAGIVHIGSILALPRLAPRDAFSRVAALAPIGKTTLLQPVAPGHLIFPFSDPATALGVCRYDLSKGPLQLKAVLRPEQMILFSFHSRFGQVFYSMTDRVATRGRLDVLVLTPDQLEDYEANDTGDGLPKQVRIVSPSRQGFVLLRAFARQAGDLPAARASIAAIDCATTQAPQV